VSSFIANARNKLYAFYAGKGGLLKKIRRSTGRPTTMPPLASATESHPTGRNAIHGWMDATSNSVCLTLNLPVRACAQLMLRLEAMADHDEVTLLVTDTSATSWSNDHSDECQQHSSGGLIYSVKLHLRDGPDGRTDASFCPLCI